MTKRFGALTSSQDPNAIAQKVKGTILLASSLIIFFASRFLGITLTASDIVTLATELSGIAGAVWAVYGSVLHLVTLFAEVKEA